MPEPVHPQVIVQFLSGTTLERETSVDVTPAVLDRIRAQITPAALVADTGNTITIPFRAADGVPDRIRYMYDRPHLEDVLTDGTFALGTQAIPKGEVAPREVECSVLLLLESPHIDETTKKLEAVYPAAGDTGGAIQRKKDAFAFLLEQVPAERLGERTPFILANPVPHPTSCRCEPIEEPLRNHVMKFALTEVDRIRDEFERRLRDYHPVVIINACTGKGSPHGLPSIRKRKPDPKELVRRALWRFFDGEPIHRICCQPKLVQVTPEEKHRVLQIHHFPPEGSVTPAYYVVDFPHPSGWYGIWDDGWFWDQGFATWLAEREQH